MQGWKEGGEGSREGQEEENDAENSFGDTYFLILLSGLLSRLTVL